MQRPTTTITKQTRPDIALTDNSNNGSVPIVCFVDCQIDYYFKNLVELSAINNNMSSEGPYGRHGFNANPSGYGSYSNPPQGAAGGYAAPSYGGAAGGQGYGGSYSAPAPASGGSYGGGAAYDIVSISILILCFSRDFMAVQRHCRRLSEDSLRSFCFVGRSLENSMSGRRPTDRWYNFLRCDVNIDDGIWNPRLLCV